jgi:hypothetical protein
VLVDKAQGAQGSAPEREPGPDRLVTATKHVVRAVTPSNLDDDLPGKRVAHGFNIGLTPVLFAAVGYGIDYALGILPVFTITLTVLSVVGLLTRFYYSYKATVDAEELAFKERKTSHERRTSQEARASKEHEASKEHGATREPTAAKRQGSQR